MHKLFVVIVVSLIGTTLAGAEQPPRPNIILVMADDMGWSDVGCYGGEIRTPHIDSLAKDGIRFRQFYNNAICGPTRVSLLTGLYCQQVGHRGDRWNEPVDHDKCVLISELLRRGGYRTAMVGKWQGRESPLDRGFDRFFGPLCQGKISYFHEVQQNPYFLDRMPWTPPKTFYLTESINEYAVQFLKEAVKDKSPFFLHVAHLAPHWPLHAREADVAPYRQTYLEHGWDQWRERRLGLQKEFGLVPPGWNLSPRPTGVGEWKAAPNKEWQAERMAVYAAQVESIDRGLGQLLAILRESGQEKNTLVMFLSDNGAAPDGGLVPTSSGFGFDPKQPNNRWRKDGVEIRPGSGPGNLPGPHNTFAAYGLAWASVSNAPLRGTKVTGYEGGIRTPLIARWPSFIRSGQLTNQVGHVIDFMATILEVAGLEYPFEFQSRKPLPLEGQSLLPVLAGRDRKGHEMLGWSVPQHFAIRMGNWKAIRLRTSEKWQLFDLDADGTETTDLADREPARVAELARHWERWRDRVGAKD